MSKPVYNAVTKFSPHKLVIVRSRKLDHLTGRESRRCFNALRGRTPTELVRLRREGEHKPFLDRMATKTLKETLSQGVAYIREGLTESDHHIVEQLFDSGAVQIAVVTRDLYWDLNISAHLVVNMDTHFYNDYPVTDVVQVPSASAWRLNPGMIAAYYYINYTTIELFNLSLNPRPAGDHLKDNILMSLAARLPNKLTGSNGTAYILVMNTKYSQNINFDHFPPFRYIDPHIKTYLLLQAHLSCLQQ
ncbi:hypothetical protein quinque_008786 [Culex quinquefasciatus]